jgi:hypothetical protein
VRCGGSASRGGGLGRICSDGGGIHNSGGEIYNNSPTSSSAPQFPPRRPSFLSAMRLPLRRGAARPPPRRDAVRPPPGARRGVASSLLWRGFLPHAASSCLSDQGGGAGGDRTAVVAGGREVVLVVVGRWWQRQRAAMKQQWQWASPVGFLFFYSFQKHFAESLNVLTAHHCREPELCPTS